MDLLHDLFHKRVCIESAFVDGDSEPGTARWPHVPVLHDKIALRHDWIGPDDPETKNEFTRGHDVLSRTTGIEMGAGGGFELRQHGKTAAIDLEIGRFGNRGDFPSRRYAPMLVELDAEDISRVGGHQSVSIVDRSTGLVGHEPHPCRSALDGGHTPEIRSLHWLL